MNKSIEIAFGFLVIAVVVVGFVVAGIVTMPNTTEIATARTMNDDDLRVPSDTLITDLADQIKGYERNGNIPVTVDSSEIGKTNPFLP